MIVGLVAAILVFILRIQAKHRGCPQLDSATGKEMQIEFGKRFERMLDLVARGRGIELLLRIADQTTEGLSRVRGSYEALMDSGISIPNLHPPKTLPRLFSDPEERSRLELAREIGDKLAHGQYRETRKRIRKYRDKFGLNAELNSDSLPGWRVDAGGHITEEDGRAIDKIVDMLSSSAENLIIEEFDVFVHNNYDIAAREIFDDAWRRIASNERSLAIQTVALHMFRGFKRGKRYYVEGKEE